MKKNLIVSLVLLMVPFSLLAQDCDSRCLNNIVQRYQAALLKQDYTGLPWADRVMFTENDVAMMIGDGLWGTATTLSDDSLVIADPDTGNVLWLGIVEEHGLPAYYALRLREQDRKITEVETVLGREGTPGPFAKTGGFKIDQTFSRTLSKLQQRPRARMIALVEGYYNSLQLNDGVLLTEISTGCSRRENGVSTTHDAAHWAAAVTKGCKQQLETGLFKTTDSVRYRRFPVVNEETGVVVAISLHDQAVRYTRYKTLNGKDVKVPIEYPNTFSMLEVFKIVDGEIQQIEAVSAFQPYLMPTKWTH